MAVTLGQYKAHFWTWTNSWEEFRQVRGLRRRGLHPPPSCPEQSSRWREPEAPTKGWWPQESHTHHLSHSPAIGRSWE